MDNIRLISILSSQPVQGVTQPTAAAGVTTQGMASILASLPAGSILAGYIVNRDASGNPVLRTDKGDVTFASQFFLKIGSEVVIRVEHMAGNIRAHILTVNGQPPEIAAAQSAFTDEPEIIVGREPPPAQARHPVAQGPAATISASPASSPAATITGTVLPSPPGQPPSILPPGTQIALKLVSITAPVPPAGETVAPPPASTPASYTAYARAAATPTAPAAAPGATFPAQQTAPAVAAFPAAPSNVPLPSQAVITPAAAPAVAPTSASTAPPPPSATTVVTATSSPPQPATALPAITAVPASIQLGQTLQAAVIGREPSGEIVVQTPAGLIRLPPGIQLPPHSQVTFEVTAIAPGATPAATPAASTSPPAPATELARGWETLRQIVALLTDSTPSPGLPAPPGALPLLLQPDPKGTTAPQNLSTGLLLFIVALKGGGFRNWLGEDNAQWLENRGHGALLKAAEGDFMGLARRYAEAPPQHWQPLFFPVAAPGGEIQQARLFVKRDRSKKDGDTGEPGKNEDTRFILEVDLSQLGGMQMDGFVRRRERNIEFDLIVRSLAPLGPEDQNNILKIYNETGELTGYRGQISFQPVREFPVNPMEELIAEHISSVIA